MYNLASFSIKQNFFLCYPRPFGQFGNLRLVNFRGLVYSLNHTKLDINDPEFWRFSMDEMIHIDLPLMIDYILATTKSDTLTYIGYSQGNILMFALMSENDHYQQLVKPFISLSPSWFLNARTYLINFKRFVPYLK